MPISHDFIAIVPRCVVVVQALRCSCPGTGASEEIMSVEKSKCLSVNARSESFCGQSGAEVV